MKLIKFSASWCAPCKMLAKTMDGMEIPFFVENIDIEENEEAAIKFGVRGVPTVVLMDGETEVKRFTGFKNETQLKEWFTV